VQLPLTSLFLEHLERLQRRFCFKDKVFDLAGFLDELGGLSKYFDSFDSYDFDYTCFDIPYFFSRKDFHNVQ